MLLREEVDGLERIFLLELSKFLSYEEFKKKIYLFLEVKIG